MRKSEAKALYIKIISSGAQNSRLAVNMESCHLGASTIQYGILT